MLLIDASNMYEACIPSWLFSCPVVRCEVKSGGLTLGVMAAVVLFLLGPFPFVYCCNVLCMFARMSMCDPFFFFFKKLLCNAVSDLGRNMRQRDMDRAE